MGGSSTPSAPSHKKEIQMLDKSAKWSFENAQEMMDWARDAYAKTEGLSDITIDNALKWMDTMGDWATADRKRYEEVFQPLEDQLVADAQSYASPERIALESGKAQADVAAKFDQARQNAQDRLEAFGVDPSQTRQGALDLGTRVAQGAAQASAGNQARWNTEATGRDLRNTAIQLGLQYPGRAITEAQGSGNFGTSAVNQRLATVASGAQTMGTPAQWQQIGNQGATAASGAKSQSYQDKLAAAQAKAQESSGIGEVVGTVAGFIPFMDEGGVIPDDASPSGGQVTDDVPAQIEGGPPAKLNAGEFIVPKDVTSWVGEKGLQQFILKARKEMTGGNGERPAQPTMQPQYESVGAIPEE